MADLRNSQRISYKATYNQISAGPAVAGTGEHPAKSPSRAIEKAAFAQTLQLTPHELAAIADRLAVGSNDQERGDSGRAEALAAIEHLINDRTATSTLNNAALFAEVDPATLAEVATELVAHRQEVVSAVNASIARILSTYRSSLAAPPATDSTNSGSTEGTAGHASTTAAGVPILTTVAPITARTLEADSGRVVQGYTAHVWVDESKTPPAGLSGVHGTASSAQALSNTAALAWAEQHQPELFAEMVGHLAPYTGLSADERTAIGDMKVLALMTAKFKSTLDEAPLHGAIRGFRSRMAIEPVGNLHLERIEMYPAGVERGELAHSVPLAPGETVNISHKEWSVSEKEFEEIVNDYFEGYSEEGVAEKTDIAMSNDSQSQHSTALNIGASLSASYATVTLSTNFGYNATSNDSRSKKDSRNHSMAITKKASARTKKDHKVTFKVTSVAGSEDQSVRVISNPSDTDSMRIDYFQLARKWKVDLLRYGLRMTYDVVIPNPGSGIVSLVDEVKALEAVINTPFTFPLALSAITYDSLAADPKLISNYDLLAAQYGASVAAPPEARKWVNVTKNSPDTGEFDKPRFESAEFDIDEKYYISAYSLEVNADHVLGDTRGFVQMLNGLEIVDGLNSMIGMSGHLSVAFVCQFVRSYMVSVTFDCRPKVEAVLDWRLQVWNELRSAAEDQYNKDLQTYKDQQAKLIQQIADFDALTLRRMEQEEIMKGVLRWLLGPQFSLVPLNIWSMFGSDNSDPGVTDVLDPNLLTNSEWLDVMEFGEFIKYIHNAIEWENVLYFTYPYFWDDYALWDFKKFLFHPDATHRTFLRSGAARVVLTIRPGFEPSFTSLIESGAFDSLPGPHPYVTIAQEIQDFANTNYPGFPPANPEQNARPLLYLEQRRVWTEMQFMIQLLNACKSETGAYPPSAAGNAVPAAALTPYLDGAVVINGTSYNGVNDYNTQANNQQLGLDPTTPQEALLPTYANVPVNDVAWNNPYFYKCPGDAGDYDLVCFGADGVPGGVDKDADISANCEASLISTWFEYTPINGMDIGITKNQPNIVPPQPSTEIA